MKDVVAAQCVACAAGLIYETSTRGRRLAPMCPPCMNKARRSELRLEARHFAQAEQHLKLVICDTGAHLPEAARVELLAVTAHLHGTAEMLRDHARERRRSDAA